MGNVLFGVVVYYSGQVSGFSFCDIGFIDYINLQLEYWDCQFNGLVDDGVGVFRCQKDIDYVDWFWQ